MIVTVTMNPAIDKTVEVGQLVYRGLNWIRRVEYDAGGKGINVSKTIHALGGTSVATGFLGGNNGQVIANVLKEKGICCDFIWVDGETRTNTKVVEEDGFLTELNEPGALIREEDISQLKQKLLGYANPYDTWAVLLITKVLTVYYDCSRDERIPEALYRVLKNYYELLKDGTVRLFNWGKSRWYDGFIAINFAYERFPEAWLLELAAMLKEQGMDWDTAVPLWKRPLNLWRQETHVVNLAMLLKAEAVSCDLLGLPYTDPAQYWLDELRRYNGTPVGAFTGEECLSGLSPIQGTELCAVVEQMYAYELLYAHTGDHKWAERLEMLAFNALPATVSDDMWTHQYVQMSNQIACQTFPGKSLFCTNGPDAHIFGLEPHFGCCTSNFGQGWPKLTLSAFMHQGDTVISSIPMPSELKTDDKHILLETNYPFDHSFTYTVESKADFTFRIRIPSFAKNLTVNGETAPVGDLTFAIKAGEQRTITVSYDAEPCFEERPYGLRTVRWGSLVFSLPIRYEKRMHEYEKKGVQRKFPYCDYEYVPVSDWNYAYSGETLRVEKRTVEEIPFSSAEPPVVIHAEMRKIDWGLEDGYETVCAKQPQSLAPISGPEEIALYPYGCAKLRITEAPFVGE